MNERSFTHGPDKRQRILDATLGLISRHGFHNTSMAMIAREAGVAAGTIYLYFPGKEDLIRELYRELMQQTYLAILADDDDSLDFRARLRRLWIGSVHYHLTHSQAFTFLEQYSHSPCYGYGARVTHPRLEALIDTGLAQGRLKPLDRELLHSLAYGPISSLVKKHLAGLVCLNDELIGQAFEACWDALSRPSLATA